MIMVRKIGEIFEYKGEWYQCVEGDSCGECSFFDTACSSDTKDDNDDIIGVCSPARRDKAVIFKKLEKVGEPYIAENSVVSGRPFQKYRLYEQYFTLNEKNLLFTSYGNIVSIEIKQTQEDMEEKKLNLKPFDLEAARSGKPVCTRDGRKARIICFDAQSEQPIIALVEHNHFGEIITQHHENGAISESGTRVSNSDLMMLPEKKGGVGEYCKNRRWGYCCKGAEVHSDYNDAILENINVLDKRGITVKIVWEE